MLVYGHRGDSATHPENTLVAFASAIAAGAAGIELDLRATADGVLVVAHDRSLQRTAGIDRAIDCLTLAELRSLTGDVVPTLTETLAIVGGRVALDLEVKQAGIEEPLARMLRDCAPPNWAVSSFDWSVLLHLRDLLPGAVTWPLADRVTPALLEAAARCGSPAVALWHGAITPSVISEVGAAGLSVMAWTVNDVAEAFRLRDLGVMALCSDDPARIIGALAG